MTYADKYALIFQSTRPLRGATKIALRHIRTPLKISIHAPLAGRDAQFIELPPLDEKISIHAPLAGRDRIRLC